MRSHIVTNLITYSVLAASGGLALVLPNQLVAPRACAAAPADTMQVGAVIRDFRKGDNNINHPPAGGNGHYVGNIALALNSENRPVFAGGGNKVTTQWRDLSNKNIAPHMYAEPGNGREIRLVSAPSITGSAILDTFNSVVGPYGGTNVGPAPVYKLGSTMPVLTVPPGMGPITADITLDGNGITTHNSNKHVNNMTVQNQRTLRIQGHLIYLIEEKFTIQNFAKIEIMANSSLKVYFKKDFYLQDNVDLNMNTGDPSKLMFYNLGTVIPTFQNSARCYARIESPNAPLLLKNSVQFYGSITAKSLNIDNNAGVHVDDGGTLGLCGVPVNDKIGVKGAGSAGGIPSAAAFDKWYSDIMGTNLSMVRSLELTDNGSGVYELLSDNFYPADDLLFGNEGQAHNYYYTLAIESTFNYDACTGQFFEFRGSDDAWLFVNRKLVIDLGGVLPAVGQYVNMDRLKLVDGQMYTLHFFFAQRNSSMSQFRMRTNLPLIQTMEKTMTAGVD